MNFKSIGLAGVAAATLMTAATVTVAPASAADIAGSQLSFSGGGKFTTTATTGRINFTPFSGNFPILGLGPSAGNTFGRAFIGDTSTGYFADRSDSVGNPEQFRIKDLNFTTLSPTSWKLTVASGEFVDDFFKFADGVTFDLYSFNLTKAVSGVVSGDYTGIFADADGNQFPGLDGSFSSQAKFTLTGDTYSSSITPIPTPALLPGLIGMGVAAIRKRKSEKSEVEAAETVKA